MNLVLVLFTENVSKLESLDLDSENAASWKGFNLKDRGWLFPGELRMILERILIDVIDGGDYALSKASS